MRKLIILGLVAVTLTAAATVNNLKYDIAEQRIVISCVDHKPPTVHVLNPASGAVVVVDCEREK